METGFRKWNNKALFYLINFVLSYHFVNFKFSRLHFHIITILAHNLVVLQFAIFNHSKIGAFSKKKFSCRLPLKILAGCIKISTQICLSHEGNLRLKVTAEKLKLSELNTFKTRKTTISIKYY